MRYREALNLALREEMEADDRVFLMGEDIGVFQGAFKVTAGLMEEFGERRVRDTPISENTIVGMGVAVRTARALFRGPLTQTAQALCDGELSPAHATVLAQGTHDAARPPDRRGRAGPGGGGPPAGPTPAPAGRWASGGGGRPRG